MVNAWFRKLLRCPQCGSELKSDAVFSCGECDFHDESGKDLRPKRPRKSQIALSNMLIAHPTELLVVLDTTCPDLTYNGPSAIRDSRQLMSEVSKRLPQGGTALDLGCGPRDQFAPLNFLGFDYVGVDFDNPAADLLADAHSIPFSDASFDCVFSYAVLEHLHNPFIAIQEISRVLKPGGWFIGTVSQGEPFHSSYFHHTPWGMLSLVGSAPDLKVVRMWASVDTLQSLASMGRYSRVLKAALAGLNSINTWMPWLTPRKMMWADKDKQLDRLYRAGSICFAIEKSAHTGARD
jgi:SAM-dependent methyltransferase